MAHGGPKPPIRLQSGGRWERSSTKNFVDRASDAKALEKVGVIIDVAARAAALGDEFAAWADLPAQVLAPTRPPGTWNGRNRLRACELAGISPSFIAVTFDDDEQVAAFVSSANDHRRDQSPGVRWMRIGIALQRQGKRRGGRWERSSTKNFVDRASDAKALFRIPEI